MGLLQGDRWFCLPPLLNPAGAATLSAYAPTKNCFSLCYSLLGRIEASHYWFSELDVWGRPIPQLVVLKARMLDVGSRPFTPQGEAGGCEFPTDFFVPVWMSYLWNEFVPAFKIYFNVNIFLFAQ